MCLRSFSSFLKSALMKLSFTIEQMIVSCWSISFISMSVFSFRMCEHCKLSSPFITIYHMHLYTQTFPLHMTLCDQFAAFKMLGAVAARWLDADALFTDAVDGGSTRAGWFVILLIFEWHETQTSMWTCFCNNTRCLCSYNPLQIDVGVWDN